ncbi:MAG: family N-acetyltransferase, partial [Chitinophagaceae bacterium]|nr:family N-acetyltransferase [Chitinophagaceae bacterium]
MSKILDATENDFPIIRQIAENTWPQTFGSILSEAQIAYMLDMMYSIDALKNQVKEKQHRFILAKEDNHYLGYASYELHHKGSAQTKIHKIYTLPESQRKSVGKSLIAHITEQSRQSGDRSLSLNVNRNNPAVLFYEKIGFHKTGE